MSRCCPRCGGDLRQPDLMESQWRCADCGPVFPFQRPAANSAEILTALRERVLSSNAPLPLWCPWPLLPGWTVSGVAWVGDDRSGPRATALALSGPAPLSAGPAEIVFVAEEPGIGLGTGLAGRPGADPGECLAGDGLAGDGLAGDRLAGGRESAPMRHSRQADAKLRVGGHPTPLWAVESAPDRTAFVGEARGLWLVAVAWPASAGYILAEEISLTDLVEALPSELVFGAPSRQLHPHRPEG